MAKGSKITAGKSKKVLKKEVAGTLAEVFPEIKAAVGEKKFSKKVKKASKILSAGTLKKVKKETPKKVREVKGTKVSKKAKKAVTKEAKNLPETTKLAPAPVATATT